MADFPKPFSSDNKSEIIRLEAALEAANVGAWELDLTDNLFRLCDRFSSIFDHVFDPITSFDTVLTQIHPDDREKTRHVIDSLIASGTDNPLDIEFRILEKGDAAVRWINCKGQIHFNEEGVAKNLSGVILNVTRQAISRQLLENKITQLQKKEEEKEQTINLLQSVFDSSIGGISVFKSVRDQHGEIIDFEYRLVNKITEQTNNRTDLIGKLYSQMHSGFRQSGLFDILKKVTETGENVQHEIHYIGEGLDKWYDIIAVKQDDGVALSFHDITSDMMFRQQLITNEARFRSLIEEASVASCLFVGKEMRIEIANDTMLGYWGKDRSVIGKPLIEAVPELIGQPFPDILDKVFTTGETFTATNAMSTLEVDGVLSDYYFDFTYKPLRNAKGEVYAVMDTAVDVTGKLLAQKALEASESRLRTVISSAPVSIAVLVGRDFVMEMINQTFIDILGKGQNIQGKPLLQVMPELENQSSLKILNEVFTTGKMHQSFGRQVDIMRNGEMTQNFYNTTYTPLLDNDGHVYAILEIATDVTERVLIQQKIEESQIRLLSLFGQSPVAIAIIDKTSLNFTMANPFYGELVGRSPEELVGKSLLEALPELTGQGFDKLLNSVIETGVPFFSKERKVEVVRKAGLETIFVNLSYQPQRDMNDTISGILVLATDVTEQVLARKNVEEAEIMLRGAVELANLGTWQIDLTTGILDYSERLRGWFNIGIDEIITIERGYEPIRQSDRPRIKAAIMEAIKPDGEGIYDIEYTVEATHSNPAKILHAQGKTYFDENGVAVKISGAVQDITDQRMTQLALEQQVQERTEELETTNEELASINEEYAATNEELGKSNELLLKSNENLQQFAYIASHDLQEPLRKIQSFGDLLKNRFSENLGQGVEYLNRMQGAARRMSALIDDLLAFSRVSSHKDIIEPVSLPKTIAGVINDLEVTIQEKGASIRVGELPVISGDQMQLGQLFQNLVSNALKFHSPDQAPVITISSEMILPSDIPAHVKPARASLVYHRIDVADNGIGFDEKYIDRIFQLFQRLHGKTEYAGTGIGLAICEKVATNHGGAITATSELGVGSVFSVYFPV